MVHRTLVIATLGAFVAITSWGAPVSGRTETPAKGEYPPAPAPQREGERATRDEQRVTRPQTPPKGQYPPAALPGGNRWLEQQVLVRLIENGIGPDVVVVADDWQVTLTGDVASESARQRAAEITKRFPGVTSVDNQLDVLDAAAASPDTRPRNESARQGSLRAHPGGLIEPRWLIGQPVLDAQDQPLGTVSHIWAEPTSGKIQELIVASDGVHHFVPWDDVEVVWDRQTPMLKLSGGW